MQIVINIEKKHLYAFVLLIGLFGSFTYAYNAGGTGGTPNIMGHSFDEMAGGTMELGAVNCNAYDVGDDCIGNISGITIKGQPGPTGTMLSLKDLSPTVPGGDTLMVDGNAMFKCSSASNCQVSFTEVVRGQIPGQTLPLCIKTASNETNGALVLC